MRKYFMLLAAVSLLGLRVQLVNAATDPVLARTDGDLVVRLHFAGTTRVTAPPIAVKLREFANLPTMPALRESLVRKLSTAPYRLLQKKLANGTTNDYSELLRPLVDDLFKEESYAEMRGPTNAIPELMLAVHLDNAHAKIWNDNLATVVSAWTGIAVKPISGDGFAGWELKKHHDPNTIRCLRAGEWVLFGWGENEIRLQPSFLQRIKQNRRPVESVREEWLDLLVDWPTIMRYHPFTLPEPLPAKLPKMHLTLQTQTDYVRPKLTMQYPEALNLRLDPWQIPTHLIKGTPASFTAMRGVGPYLGNLNITKEIQPPYVPNQLTFWSIAKVPFETYVVAPVSGASNYLAQFGPRVAAMLEASLSNKPIPAEALWTNGRVYVVNMPFIGPYLQPIREPSGEFILGGLFPSTQRTNSPAFPPALLKEIQSKPNLVYYSWELQGERIPQWQSVIQVGLLLAKKMPPSADAPGLTWLTNAEPKLGNCFTEISQTAPDELTLVRNAPLGLSGLEMDVLEFWIDAPGFPFDATYSRPKRPRSMAPPPPSR